MWQESQQLLANLPPRFVCRVLKNEIPTFFMKIQFQASDDKSEGSVEDDQEKDDDASEKNEDGSKDDNDEDNEQQSEDEPRK